jgi:GT2 family glycosyltransferase
MGMSVSDGTFEEEVYLILNPDVRHAVMAGNFRSGREHWERFGRAEGRPNVLGTPPRGQVLANGVAGLPGAPEASVDHVKMSPGGGLFVDGWVNDAFDPLETVTLYFAGWMIALEAAALARVRRADAEEVVPGQHAFGFLGFHFSTTGQRLAGGACSVVLRLASGAQRSFRVAAGLVDDEGLRGEVCAALARAKFFGNPYFEAVAAVAGGFGAQLAQFNAAVSRRAVGAPFVARFGARTKFAGGSIIVCLFGRTEFLFLQAAVFARAAGMADYEFIYVCNSPELAEQVMREARNCARIYGLDTTVILCAGNAGFGAANNLGVQYARSDRVLIMNPDVFPYEFRFLQKHTALVRGLPPAQTAMFGVPMFYDNGALMHAGMYVQADSYVRFTAGHAKDISVLRVEHFGKNVPASEALTSPHEVPAVTGAFISADRAWFETLGGFSGDYVFGHYEDADLCLRSAAAGRAVWLQDARLYHLEGKGGVRDASHEGGAIVNRWLFTKSWAGNFAP